MANVRKLFRNAVVDALAFLPLTANLLKVPLLKRCILWILFRLEVDEITVAAAGPRFCRYRMWLNWQDGTAQVLGTYEPWVAKALRHHLKARQCCFDIGAHIGYHAILMSRLVENEGLVAAFEPLPETFEMLEKNVALNELRNVKLERAALGEKNDRLFLTFATHEKLTMTPSVSGYKVGGQGGIVEVPSRSLDSYVADSGTDPDFMLIDVEAAELAVLRGAAATLSRARPKLLIEIHGCCDPESHEVSRYLSQFGYKGKLLAERGNEGFMLFVADPQQ